jgi:hypothetical protein
MVGGEQDWAQVRPTTAFDCAGAGYAAEPKQDEGKRSGGLRVLRRALFPVVVIPAPALHRAADFAPRRWAVLRSGRQLLLNSFIRPRMIERGRRACHPGRIDCVGPTVRNEGLVAIARPSFFSPTPHRTKVRGAFLWWRSRLSLLINNDPCVQSQCQRDPHSAHRPICEQPRGSCEVCLELCG